MSPLFWFLVLLAVFAPSLRPIAVVVGIYVFWDYIVAFIIFVLVVWAIRRIYKGLK